MIIITENKKQHYIIKNFLKEISKVSLNEAHQDYDEEKERYYVGEWPALKDEEIRASQKISDKQIVDQNQPTTIQQLKKAAQIKPKMRKLINLVKGGLVVSIITAGGYFYSDINDKELVDKIARDNQVPVQKVIQTSAERLLPNEKEEALLLSPNKDEFVSDTAIDREETADTENDAVKSEKRFDKNQRQKSDLLERAKLRIKTFEGFKPYPYKDKKGVSIGYGTFFMNNVKPDNLPDNWIDSLYEKCGISDTEKAQYENASQKELFEEFSDSIENQKLKIDNIIERVKTKIKLKDAELGKWQKIKNARKRKIYTDNVKIELERLDKRVESLEKQKEDLEKEKETANSRGLISNDLAEVCLDRFVSNSIDYHSSGSSTFNKNFFKMDKNVQDVIIDMSYNVGMYFLDVEFTNFDGFVKEYANAINKNNAQEKVNALKNMYEEVKDRSPKYHAQQSLNRRAEKNTNLLKLAYEKEKNKLKESVYSLKTAFNILYS